MHPLLNTYESKTEEVGCCAYESSCGCADALRQGEAAPTAPSASATSQKDGSALSALGQVRAAVRKHRIIDTDLTCGSLHLQRTCAMSQWYMLDLLQQRTLGMLQNACDMPKH